jgi:hypothetical protein
VLTDPEDFSNGFGRGVPVPCRIPITARISSNRSWASLVYEERGMKRSDNGCKIKTYQYLGTLRRPEPFGRRCRPGQDRLGLIIIRPQTRYFELDSLYSPV